jgi:hypothetical protein
MMEQWDCTVLDLAVLRPDSVSLARAWGLSRDLL